jgi:hypothetical protein
MEGQKTLIEEVGKTLKDMQATIERMDTQGTTAARYTTERINEQLSGLTVRVDRLDREGTATSRADGVRLTTLDERVIRLEAYIPKIAEISYNIEWIKEYLGKLSPPEK